MGKPKIEAFLSHQTLFIVARTFVDLMGKRLIRAPMASNIALPTAVATEGTPRSPTPPFENLTLSFKAALKAIYFLKLFPSCHARPTQSPSPQKRLSGIVKTKGLIFSGSGCPSVKSDSSA